MPKRRDNNSQCQRDVASFHALAAVWPWGAPCQYGVAFLSVTHTAALCQTPRMLFEMEP